MQFADEIYSRIVSPERNRRVDSEVNKIDDPNLKFQDQLQAYTKYVSKGHFTPAPPETQDVNSEKENLKMTSRGRVRQDDEVTTAPTTAVGDDIAYVSTLSIYRDMIKIL